MDGTKHNTFKDVSIAMGLLVNNNEWHQALEEAGLWALGRQLRDMFASMLMFCEVTNPRQLWDAHWESLSDDIEVMTRREHDDLIVSLFEDALKDRALYEINQVLIRNEHCLEVFHHFRSLITSLLFMEETDWSKRSWLMISIH